MTSSPSHAIRSLDFDDLDQVVGGAGTVAPSAHEDPHDAFTASLAGITAIAATNAAALAAGHETAAAAISAVEHAAQAAQASTDAALTALLMATHGKTQVATELSTRLVDGAAANELVQLTNKGQMAVGDVQSVAQSAVDALASFSKDGQSVLGLSKGAALDVIDAKIGASGHAGGNLPIDVLQPPGPVVSWTLPTVDTSASTSNLAASTITQSNNPFSGSFDLAEATRLQAGHEIEIAAGGALEQGLLKAATDPLAAHKATVLGETASLIDAFGGTAADGLVSQIKSTDLAMVTNVMSGNDHVATDVAAAMASVETAAGSANVSTDAALTVLLNATHDSQVATELSTRLIDNAAANEIVQLVGAGHLDVGSVNQVATQAVEVLASASTDKQSALGMSEGAALDVIDASIATSSENSSKVTPSRTGWTTGHSDQASQNIAAFSTAFAKIDAPEIGKGQEIAAADQTFGRDLLFAASNPLAAHTSTVLGETASLIDAFGGTAADGLVSKMVGSSDVMASLTTLISGQGTHAISNLEAAAQTAGVSTDLALAIAAQITPNVTVRDALATELNGRIANGAFAADMKGLESAEAVGFVHNNPLTAMVDMVAGAAGMNAAETASLLKSFQPQSSIPQPSA